MINRCKSTDWPFAVLINNNLLHRFPHVLMIWTAFCRWELGQVIIQHKTFTSLYSWLAVALGDVSRECGFLLITVQCIWVSNKKFKENPKNIPIVIKAIWVSRTVIRWPSKLIFTPTKSQCVEENEFGSRYTHSQIKLICEISIRWKNTKSGHYTSFYLH